MDTAAFRPPLRSNFVFTAENEFEGHAIQRANVSEFFGDFELPPYENGAYVWSMVPLGRIGTLVFLEDDVNHFYVVPFSSFYDVNMDIEWVRRFAESCR